VITLVLILRVQRCGERRYKCWYRLVDAEKHVKPGCLDTRKLIFPITLGPMRIGASNPLFPFLRGLDARLKIDVIVAPKRTDAALLVAHLEHCRDAMPHPVDAKLERDPEVLLVPALLSWAGLESMVRHSDKRAVRHGHVDGDVPAGGIEEMLER